MKTNKTGTDYGELYQTLLNCILNGKGFATHEQRRAAFNNAGLSQPLRSLVDNVANCAYKVTDSDIVTVKKTGVSEDELFELIVCAAAGQASRQYERGLAALAEAMKEGGKHAS